MVIRGAIMNDIKTANWVLVAPLKLLIALVQLTT